MKERINISIDDELLSQADDYADKMHQSRSGFISMCIATYIQQQEMMGNLPQLINLYQKALKEE